MNTINNKLGLGIFSGNRRTSIRMSKLARTLQTAAAKTNWEETVKMLFWADMDRGRSNEVRKMVSLENRDATRGAAESYSSDQFQYMLLLMLIISIAEKRTQDIYNKEFADRCDVISKDHDLQDDRFWEDGNVPPEWEALNQEFEDRSMKILQETLQEYGQNDLANLIKTDGPDQLFNIVDTVRSQFFKVLENSRLGNESPNSEKDNSIPESLQPSAFKADPLK